MMWTVLTKTSIPQRPFRLFSTSPMILLKPKRLRELPRKPCPSRAGGFLRNSNTAEGQKRYSPAECVDGEKEDHQGQAGPGAHQHQLRGAPEPHRADAQ